MYRLALTAAVPSSTDTVWNTTVYPPPTNANGYPAGGATPTVTLATTTGAVFTLKLQDTVFIATSGGIGPFRYVILYDANAGNKLVGWYDYGSSVTLNSTDTFTTDFDDVSGVLTVS